MLIGGGKVEDLEANHQVCSILCLCLHVFAVCGMRYVCCMLFVGCHVETFRNKSIQHASARRGPSCFPPTTRSALPNPSINLDCDRRNTQPLCVASRKKNHTRIVLLHAGFAGTHRTSTKYLACILCLSYLVQAKVGRPAAPVHQNTRRAARSACISSCSPRFLSRYHKVVHSLEAHFEFFRIVVCMHNKSVGHTHSPPLLSLVCHTS